MTANVYREFETLEAVAIHKTECLRLDSQPFSRTSTAMPGRLGIAVIGGRLWRETGLPLRPGRLCSPNQDTCGSSFIPRSALLLDLPVDVGFLPGAGGKAND